MVVSGNKINLWRFFAHDDATPARVTLSSDPFIFHTCSGASRCGEETVSLFGGAATSCRHPCLHFRPRHSRAVPLSLSEFIKKMKETSSNTRRGHQGYKKGSAAATSCRRAAGICTKRDQNSCFLFHCDVRLKIKQYLLPQWLIALDPRMRFRCVLEKSSVVRTQRRSLARVLCETEAHPSWEESKAFYFCGSLLSDRAAVSCKFHGAHSIAKCAR